MRTSVNFYNVVPLKINRTAARRQILEKEDIMHSIRQDAEKVLRIYTEHTIPEDSILRRQARRIIILLDTLEEIESNENCNYEIMDIIETGIRKALNSVEDVISNG